MKCTFTIDRESPITRRFAVRLEATTEKPISAVETRYDGLALDRDDLSSPVTTFERLYRKDQGNSPGKHDLFVTAELADGTTESFTRIWAE
jgi:non-ribosomal peptide synthetase component F